MMNQTEKTKKKSRTPQALKGFRDFLPSDMALQNYIFDVWQKTCESFGYDEYNTPLLEYSWIYNKSGDDIGDSGKELYKFEDNGGREVALRPEMTPSVARLIAQYGNDFAKPTKWFSIAQFFRAEKPQRGRTREFFQLNADIFGSESILSDVEAVALAVQLMKNFGANESMFVLRVNNRKFIDSYFKSELGLTKEEDRNSLLKIIDASPKKSSEWLKKSCEEVKSGDKFYKDVKKYLELKLDDIKKMKSDGAKELTELFALLDKMGIAKYCEFDTSIARGLDYYTGIVFEVFDKDKENNRALFGGGRYDNLMDVFDKPRVPAVGFAQGDVTLSLFLKTWKLIPGFPSTNSTVLVTIFSEETFDSSLKIVDLLRRSGVNCELYSDSKAPLKKQLKYADKKGCKYAVIIGPDEVVKEEVVLKDLKAKSQENILTAALVTRVKT